MSPIRVISRSFLKGAIQDILPSMERFATAREAKEYLIDRIVAQASHDGVVLTDVERKMLYFTDTGWTLPDIMQVNSEFDQNYDQDGYESKIGQIIRRIHKQPLSNRDDNNWSQAVRRLRDEDHYLLVLIDGASSSSANLSRREIVRLILAGVVVVAVFLPVVSFLDSHVTNRTLFKLVGGSTLLALVVLATFIGNRAHRRSV